MSADDELIQRAKRGDAAAWRELYRAHAGRLVVWLRTRPSGDAAVAPEDLAAEAWLTAAQKIAEFTRDRRQFAGWLFGIARTPAGECAAPQRPPRHPPDGRARRGAAPGCWTARNRS